MGWSRCFLGLVLHSHRPTALWRMHFRISMLHLPDAMHCVLCIAFGAVSMVSQPDTDRSLCLSSSSLVVRSGEAAAHLAPNVCVGSCSPCKRSTVLSSQRIVTRTPVLGPPRAPQIQRLGKTVSECCAGKYCSDEPDAVAIAIAIAVAVAIVSGVSKPPLALLAWLQERDENESVCERHAPTP